MLKNPWWRATAVMILGNVIAAAAAIYWNWIGPGDWVGWIQAVGSVEAIIAAVFIAQAEHWNIAERDRIAERIQRDALVLELVPQITLLNAWIQDTCRQIERLKENKDANLMVHLTTTYRHIPKGLRGDSARLMLLGETGVKAVQVRELLRMANDSLRNFGQDFYMLNAPENIIPHHVAANYKRILSMEIITAGPLNDLSAMHDKIIPRHRFPSAVDAAEK